MPCLKTLNPILSFKQTKTGPAHCFCNGPGRKINTKYRLYLAKNSSLIQYSVKRDLPYYPTARKGKFPAISSWTAMKAHDDLVRWLPILVTGNKSKPGLLGIQNGTVLILPGAVDAGEF
jgi:hypothetical protein